MSVTTPFVYAGKINTGGAVQRLIPANTEAGGTVQSVIVKARGGNTSPLYLGNATTGGGTAGSGLTASTGFELPAGQAVAMDLNTGGLFYVFGATTNDKYDILEA